MAEAANPLSSLLNDPEAMQLLTSLAQQLGGTPAPQQSAPTAPAPDMVSRAIPLLTSLARDAQHACDPDRVRLLTALKPFFGDSVGVQFDHAVQLLSAAHMLRLVLTQLLTSGEDTRNPSQGGHDHVQQLSGTHAD